MGRGLGNVQRLIIRSLRAFGDDEAERQRYRPVAAILNKAWEFEWRAKSEAREVAREAAKEADMAEAKRQAAAGDPTRLHRLEMMNFLGSALRRSRRAPQATRQGLHVEHEVNPSRCLSLLEKRGLVERYTRPTVGPGPGSWFRLTDAGWQVPLDHDAGHASEARFPSPV
jgi:hypothetical protein